MCVLSFNPIDGFCQQYKVKINMTMQDVLNRFKTNLNCLLHKLAIVQPNVDSVDYFAGLVASLATQFRSVCSTTNWAELLDKQKQTQHTQQSISKCVASSASSASCVLHTYHMMQQAAQCDAYFFADLMVWCCMDQAFTSLVALSVLPSQRGYAGIVSHCQNVASLAARFCLTRAQQPIGLECMMQQTGKYTTGMFVCLGEYIMVVRKASPASRTFHPGQIVTASGSDQPDQPDQPMGIKARFAKSGASVHTKSFLYVLDTTPDAAVITASFCKTAACIAFPVYHVEFDSAVSSPPVMSLTSDFDYLIVDLYGTDRTHLSSVLISGITPVMCMPNKIYPAGQSVVYFTWRRQMYFLDLANQSKQPVLNRNALDSARIGLKKMNLECQIVPLLRHLMVACPLDAHAVSALPNCVVAYAANSLVVYQRNNTTYIPTQIVNLCHPCQQMWLASNSIFVESHVVSEYNFEHLKPLDDNLEELVGQFAPIVVHHAKSKRTDLAKLASTCCLVSGLTNLT